MKEKILHLIDWEWDNISSNMQHIADTGFTAIQISPVQPCKPIWTNNGTIEYHSQEWYDEIHKTWWKLYQPLGFSIGNHLGTHDDFIKVCNVAHEYGIKIIVDIILRHLADSDNNKNIPHEFINQDLLKYISKSQDNINNYHDRKQVISRSTDCIMLDYDNTELQDMHIIPFLQDILQYADGLRLDECKHFGLPNEGYSFFSNVFSKLPKDKLYYGECLQVDEYLLKQYIEYMKPLVPYGEGWGIKKECIAFKESHDTCNSFLYTLHMTDYERLMGYESALRDYGSALYYARRNDSTIFSKAMKDINSKYN